MLYSKICRKKGKVESGCDVYVSKTYMGGGWKLQNSKWAIPAHLTSLKGAELKEAYREHLVTSKLIDDIYELAYQTLGCWCKDEHTCHAGVLMDITQAYMRGETKIATGKSSPGLDIRREPIYRAGKMKTARQLVSSRPTATTTKKKRSAKKIVVIRKEKESEPPPQLMSVVTTTTKVPAVAPPWTSVFGDDAKDIEEIPLGSIPLSKVITQPIVVKRVWTEEPFLWKRGDPPVTQSVTRTTEMGLTVIFEPIEPLPTPKPDLNWFSAPTTTVPSPTPKLSSVVLSSESNWPPVVCYIARISRNKTTKRFQMILSEKTSAKANNDNSIRVHVVSQMDKVINSGFFAKDDLILAKDYSVSTIGRKKLILLAHAEKFVVVPKTAQR